MFRLSPMLKPTLLGLRPQDVFATTLYTGNRQNRSITSGIDLTGGGLTWIKGRSNNPSHALFDTKRGVGNFLSTDQTAAEIQDSISLTAFTATGFNLGTDTNYTYINAPSQTYVAGSIRCAPKFFDVVKYTGDGTSGRQIPHGLGIKPGMVVARRRNAIDDWRVYHNSIGATQLLYLSGTQAQFSNSLAWANTEPSDSVFTVGTNNNVNGAAYVAYLFAHDPDTTNGIIQCGSVTTNSSFQANVTLGWRPQFLLFKAISSIDDWHIFDTARGWTASTSLDLCPNKSAAEVEDGPSNGPTATGFAINNFYSSGVTLSYLAIRAPI